MVLDPGGPRLSFGQLMLLGLCFFFFLKKLAYYISELGL